MHASDKKPNIDAAHSAPKFVYMAGLISGKIAARMHRRMTVEAIALAQYIV